MSTLRQQIQSYKFLRLMESVITDLIMTGIQAKAHRYVEETQS